MKKLTLFLLCIILCGCYQMKDLSFQLDAVFSKDETAEKIRQNNYSEFIDYYLPGDTQETGGDRLSASFVYQRSCFIMDVNIAGIINGRYYPKQYYSDEGFFDPDRLVYSRQGRYLDEAGEEHDYFYHVYSYDDSYLAYFVSRQLIFYGYSYEEDIVGLSSRILLMAKGATVRQDDVIANFSVRDEIDFEKKQVNLFETIMPVNGNVHEFMIGDQGEDDSQ